MITQQLRARIFRAMPIGKPVTANDVLHRMREVPPGVGLSDVKGNLIVMAKLGGAVHRDRLKGATIYTRSD